MKEYISNEMSSEIHFQTDTRTVYNSIQGYFHHM